MNIFAYLIWTFDPVLFSIPGINYAPRWYGLLFAAAFFISQEVLSRIFIVEGRSKKDVEKLTFYAIVATIIGARLGHCLFYNPSYYLANPIKILMVWEGGLASHGGALGILLAIYIFCKKYKYSYLWLLDRAVIVIALTSVLIRVGNLFNSEMEGTLTNSNTGVIYARYTKEVLKYSANIDEVYFQKGGEMQSTQSGFVPITAFIKYKKGVKFELNDKIFIENQLKSSLNRYNEVTEHIDFGEKSLAYKNYQKNGREIVEIVALGKVRHTAQLYEAFYGIILMIILYWLWNKRRKILPQGFNFALFMIALWSLRFAAEFFKMNQEPFEENLTFNMGQLLSIPLTISGIVLMFFIYQRNKKMNDSK